MTGSQPKWTSDLLKDHFDRLFELHEQRTKDRLDSTRESINVAKDAADQALRVAAKAAEHNFAKSNEFPAAMQDQRADFANKRETDLRLSSLEDALSKIGGVKTGHRESRVNILNVISALASIIAILGFLGIYVTVM